MVDTWVLDATLAGPYPPWPFCPYDQDTGEVMVGLTFLSDKPPGLFLGVFHADGDAAVQEWCDDNGEALSQLGVKSDG